MIPLDKDAALERVLMADSRYRVDLTFERTMHYAADSRAETMVGALGEVLHNFSMHTNRNLNVIEEARITRLDRRPAADVEGAPA